MGKNDIWIYGGVNRYETGKQTRKTQETVATQAVQANGRKEAGKVLWGHEEVLRSKEAVETAKTVQ